VAEKTETKQSSLSEIISVVVQALILALIIRTLLFQPFSIPSGSMRPTLLEGDYLFVSKFSYGYSYAPPCRSRRTSSPVASGRTRRSAAMSPSSSIRFQDRLHQARDRPAGRPHPDARRHAVHQ
jgi:hypothetical protein